MLQLSKKQSEQRNAILEALYVYGELSRADLARLLTITPATMTELTAFMIEHGLIAEQGSDGQGTKQGRKKVKLTVLPQSQAYLGVELSETKFRFCLSDNLGQVLASQTINCQSVAWPEREEFLLTELESFVAQHPNLKPVAVGLAVPGHYDKTTQTIISNHEHWSQFQLAYLAEHLPYPLYIKNNVKCMALRELYVGSEKKNLNFLFLNLKRGIFAAYVYQQKIYGDSNFLVGEVGHVVVNPNGEACECGKRGCLQTYASISWLLNKARYLFESSSPTYLKNLVTHSEEIDLSHLITAYKMGDELVYQLIEQAMDYLVMQITNSLMTLDIDTLYVHGKLLDDSLLVERFNIKLQQSPSLMSNLNRDVKKEVKTYNDMRGAMGACVLAIQKQFIHPEIIAEN